MMASARRKLSPAKADDRKKFEPKIFDGLLSDLQAGRIPLEQVTVSDEVVAGLRAIIRKSGLVSFHISYYAEDGSRPYLKIGEYPGMDVARARKIANTVRSLADMGIDPQAGLHERLIRELEEQGTKWRPMHTPTAKKEADELEAGIKPLLEMGMDRSEAIKTYRRLKTTSKK